MATFVASLATAIVATSGDRVVDRYSPFWPSFPSSPSVGGPYTGNGDIGVVFSSEKNSSGKNVNVFKGEHVFSLGKNDFWVSEGRKYFSHLAAPTLTMALPAIGYVGNVTQNMGEGKVSTFMQSLDGSVTLSTDTIVTEDNTNAVLTSVICHRADNGPCDLTLTLRSCCGNTDLIQKVGGSDQGIWIRKENLHEATNAAHMGSCNPNDLYYNVERSFVVDPSQETLSMQNGSCPWVLDPTNVTNSPITTGNCSSSQGRWIFRSGEIVWKGGQTDYCLQSNVKLGPCANGTSNVWTINNNSSARDAGYLSTGGSCLMVVPDNSNNTLATATTVVETLTGKIVTAKSSAERVNATVPSDGVAYTVSINSGTLYTIATSVLTLRDIGCAGVRVHTEQCPDAVENMAMQYAEKFADANKIKTSVNDQASFWQSFWNASAIDITGNKSGTALQNATQIVERWYYGMQYSFGTNSRQGKVAPSLQGILTVMEPVPWNDQLTIDYNFESNYWGAGSSNRLEFMKPYIATVTNPAVLESMRERATNPGVWNKAVSTPWPGDVGSTVGSTACNDLSGSGTCGPKLSNGKGYRGAAWPSTMFPLGDGRPAPTDLSTRFVGGLVATPLIQYFEYSRDMQMLRDSIYPVVRDNAEFYASFAVDDGSGPITFPYTCAQEGCACRNGNSWYWRWGKFVKVPMANMTEETLPFIHNGNSGIYQTQKGEHNAHTDIAFASASFRKAAEYAELLGVDSDLRKNWLDLLERMPDYPTQTLTFVKNESAIVVGSELSGKPMLVEAMAGATPEEGAMYAKGANGSCSNPPCSTIVWPWCNVEYPISNFAGMWPTDEIGTMQTGKTNPQLLAAAKTTVYGLNNYTGYVFAGSRRPFANENGFGLSWPPVVRVSEASDSAFIINSFSYAAELVGHNGIMKTGGGMLENMGAVIAVNDMLLQSHAGALRFFPVWDHTTLGGASFTTLRGYGAFLVSASIDDTGVVGPIELTSEQGTDCVVETPWTSGMTVTHNGAPVATTKNGTLTTFPTQAGGSYILKQA